MSNGLEGQDNLVSTLVQLGAQLVVQELLERETTDLTEYRFHGLMFDNPFLAARAATMPPGRH